MSIASAISIEGLSKKYASAAHFALHDLSLEVQPGEIYGFLGPNGAGKSTTIRLLLNFIQPTSGRAYIQGRSITHDSVAVREQLGYVTGDGAIYGKLTGREYLDFLAELQPGTDVHYRDELARRLKADLKPRLSSLSRGNRQKIALIQAFMYKPSVLILDEPSSGLDPLMQEVFYALLAEAKERKATVFMSSHIMSEVQRVCDRVAIIRDGKLVGEKTIADLQKSAQQSFNVTFATAVPLNKLQALKDVRSVTKLDNNQANIQVQGNLGPLLTLLGKSKVKKLITEELDLEREFLQYYNDDEVSSNKKEIA